MPEPKSQRTKEFVPDWQVIAGLKRTKLDEIVKATLELQQQAKQIEAQLAELKAEGAKLLIKADVKTVLVNGARATRVDGLSSRLDKEKLAKDHGVKVLQWLEDATVRTPWTSFKITPPKAEGDEEES